MKNIAFWAFLSLLAFACSRQPDPEPIPQPNVAEVFIFGSFYGECSGNCATFFKLQGNNLFQENSLGYYDYSNPANIVFDSFSLSTAQSNLAANLLSQIPSSLSEVPNGSIGCPDCADQGGYVIYIKNQGAERYWVIDPQEEEYKTLCDKIRNTLSQM
jgi:hypothetical protein